MLIEKWRNMNLIAYDGQIELDEDDWFEADESRVRDDDDDDDDDDDWGCQFGADCLMPSFHHRSSECYTVEMALAWQEEMGGKSNDE
jgi:hypothetical protein